MATQGGRTGASLLMTTAKYRWFAWLVAAASARLLLLLPPAGTPTAALAACGLLWSIVANCCVLAGLQSSQLLS